MLEWTQGVTLRRDLQRVPMIAAKELVGFNVSNGGLATVSFLRPCLPTDFSVHVECEGCLPFADSTQRQKARWVASDETRADGHWLGWE